MTSHRSHQRLEVDREDLMREATALRRRAEFRVPDEPEPVVAGYRSDGSLSIYFGPDPCFHFNPQGRLRRAFARGELYRTQGETLARLNRVRSGESVELHRHDLLPHELDHFLKNVRDRLQQLLAALEAGAAECLQEIPDRSNLDKSLIDDLSRILTAPLQLAPRIPGKP